MMYDFRRRVKPFQQEKITVLSDGNDDYTYALPSFFPLKNINYGQLIKIRNSSGRLLGKNRKIIYGEIGEDEIDTVNVENFNGILRERVGRLVRKTKCFSKRKRRLICAVTLFQFYWNFMSEFRRESTPAMIEGLSNRVWQWNDFLHAELRHIK